MCKKLDSSLALGQVLLGFMVLWIASNCASADQREQFFEAKVRPLLLDKCVECHGPDESSADLRLDQNPVSKQGIAIVPGKPDESLLVHSIRYAESAKAMPPDRKLDDSQIAILTQWIADGAYWPEEKNAAEQASMLPPAKRIDEFRQQHWSFQPIAQVTPPAVNDPSWIQQPLDNFILSKLEQSGLSASPPADKRTLIRRAYYLLTGLPPSYEQIEAFVADNSEDAFARVVDDLLQSPHYGERWARYWLDLARFAETTGYQAGSVDTTYPYAYTYRDYVIHAFNSDKPFDQFVIEQIAADRLDLPEDQKSALAALGFLTVGRKFMGRVHDIIDDRIDVVTRGFLGLSVTCARCHDHKYDPIPIADYYSLYGVFASSSEPSELPIIGDPQANPNYKQFLDAKAAKELEVEQWLDKKRQQTEQELRSRVADYLIYFAKIRPGSGHTDVKQIGDRGALRPQAVQRWKKFLDDQDLSQHPVWSLWKGLAALPAEEFQSRAQQLLADDSTAPFLQFAHPGLLQELRQSKPETMEAVSNVIGKQLEQADKAWREAIEKDQSRSQLDDAQQEQLRLSLYQEAVPTVLDLDQMRSHLNQAESNEYNQQLGKIKAVESTHPGAPARAMVVHENNQPHNPVVFLRGQPGNRGDSVPRRFLQVLAQVDGGQLYTDTSGRLELAKAIANPRNPLTARVIVNRVWQQHFGYGLVRTASDFGSRGETPSHPELLDYLAAEFMMDGWSIKRLQRRLMLSATWGQASNYRPEAHAVDPENRLLWHMPRRRMEFEPLRDHWLSAAGTLDLSVGGRSVKIHEGANRRGLYAYVDREDVPSLLAAFDVPSPDASQAIRSKTTVPQQALYMINSQFLIDQAKSLSKLYENTADASQRIQHLYRRTLARDPSRAEIDLALRFVDPLRPELPGASQVAEDTQEPKQPVWRYGYGQWDQANNKVDFVPMSRFTGDHWQISDAFPDPQLGYLMLSGNSGHPGGEQRYSTVIRWTAPTAATISIRGKLKHQQQQGDGVRAQIVSSRLGLIKSWTAKADEVNTRVAEVRVEPGDTLDFIVDCRESDSFDSYQWAPIVGVVQAVDGSLDKGSFWNYASDFESSSKHWAAASNPLDLWMQLAQILLMSNEFAFVD